MKADRIYIFVPETLTTEKGGHVKMKCGRMAAQCAHVSARLAGKFKNVDRMTTLVKSIKNSQRLQTLVECLPLFGVDVEMQYDNLPGSRKMILQAVATVPVTEQQAKGAMLYLAPLWGCTK